MDDDVTEHFPGALRRAFLYADPAAHSLSPHMHNAAFDAAGVPGRYEAVRVPPGDLPAAITRLRAPDVLGANLSLPHKESALVHLDEVTDAARRIGAVNTIIHRQGMLIGDNTDAPGLLCALRDADAPRNGPVVVLGAGGAARAAVYALRAERDVWVWNRTLQKAERLADDFDAPGTEFSVRAAALASIPWSEVTLVINATSAGLNAPDESPLPHLPPLASGALVYDMVYKPLRTRLMRDAEVAGHRAVNGLGMLAHQAHLAFTAWTGASVSPSVFLNALERAIH